MVKVFPALRCKNGQLIRGFRIFRFRRPGPTYTAWEEKNPIDYRYVPKDTSKLQTFIQKSREI